jgi:hypothetical protein
VRKGVAVLNAVGGPQYRAEKKEVKEYGTVGKSLERHFFDADRLFNFITHVGGSRSGLYGRFAHSIADYATDHVHVVI